MSDPRSSREIAEALDRARKAKAALSRAGEETTDAKAEIARLEIELGEAETREAIVAASGSELGVVVKGDLVLGAIALSIAPGTSRDVRMTAIDDALAGPLAACADELGGIVAAAPHKYVVERPGRDAEKRTLFDVFGRLEGDAVVPSLPRSRG